MVILVLDIDDQRTLKASNNFDDAGPSYWADNLQHSVVQRDHVLPPHCQYGRHVCPLSRVAPKVPRPACAHYAHAT
jgi:hypothetical protein